MRNSDVMRVQEARIESQLGRLRNLIDRYSGTSDALPLTVQLNRFIGVWRGVIVARDRLVYRPRAISTERCEVLMARTCGERMNKVAERVEAYGQRWSSSAVIASDFALFRRQSAALMAAIEAHFNCDRSLLNRGPIAA